MPAPAIEHRQSIAVIPRGVTAISLGLFIVLAWLASGPGTIPGDIWIVQHVQRLPDDPWRRVFDFGNLLGTTPASPIVLVTLGAFALIKSDRAAFVFCLALLGLRGLAMFSKGLFDSPRPTSAVAHIRDHFDGLGFPSGHSLTATIIAGACIVIVPRLSQHQLQNRVILGLIIIWAMLCGCARIWFGAHWPSDVLGGFLLGIIMIAISLEIAPSCAKANGRVDPNRAIAQ